MFTTSYMGLVAWDQGIDPYDHSQLANNFQAIDLHDHSTGKGKRISTSGLEDGSITSAKIAPDAITPDKIPDGSLTQSELGPDSVGGPQIQNGAVGTSELQNGSVTAAKLEASVIPIGTVIMWYRPSSSIPLPANWEILDGRAWNTVSNAWGWATGNLPNFANRVPLGAALTGTGSGATNPPDIGQVGGSMTVDLTHSHAVNPHSHTVGPHQHGIGADGDHRHLFPTTIWDGSGNPIGFTATHLHQRETAVPTASGSRQSLYVPDNNRNGYYGPDVEVQMSLGGNHSHGGATAPSGSFQTSSDSTATDSRLGVVTTKPSYVGLLFLIKVR